MTSGRWLFSKASTWALFARLAGTPDSGGLGSAMGRDGSTNDLSCSREVTMVRAPERLRYSYSQTAPYVSVQTVSPQLFVGRMRTQSPVKFGSGGPVSYASHILKLTGSLVTQ